MGRILSMAQQSIEEVIQKLATMDHAGLVQALMNLDCDFPVDFTLEYLRELNEEKLRHLYLALTTAARRQTISAAG
jgi:hypothetical protein